MFTKPAIHIDGLSDREAISDCLTRFLQGIDDDDEEQLASAFTEDGVFDMTPLQVLSSAGASAWTKLEGRDKIVAELKGSMCSMDTMHSPSNIRIQIKGKTACLTAYAVAQHFKAGEGQKFSLNKEFLMGNRYSATAVKTESGLWQFDWFELRNSWCTGDMTIFD